MPKSESLTKQKSIMKKNLRIIISRTDAIGDVVLTLPVAYLLKKFIPDCSVIFLARTYTKAVVDSCIYVDEFANWDETSDIDPVVFLKNLNADAIVHIFPEKSVVKAAFKAKIPLRIGTSHRIYNIFRCNHLVNFTRKKSSLHEAQLNIKLLKYFGIQEIQEKNDFFEMFGLEKIEPLNTELKSLLCPHKFNLILHPKSKGSAREWGIKNYQNLISLLDSEKFKIFITGTDKERNNVDNLFKNNDNKPIDLMGKLSLTELISFINEADGLIACSTGPLHIAAALNKKVVGIFPPIKPMHPGRWAPLGKYAEVIFKEIECSKCRKSKHCECIEAVKPEEVFQKLEKLISL